MIPDSPSVLPDFPRPDWGPAIEALVERREVVLPGILPPACWRALRAEAEALHDYAGFQAARIGRGEDARQDSAVRGDALCWLDADMPAGAAYLRWMDDLRAALNRELFLGISEFEAHYAHYAPGAFYRRHVDRHRDSNARVVSAVLYLNPDWPADAGGEFVMYARDGEQVRYRQRPEGGTLLLFMSADMPHEVLPATQARWSIAGWFRTRSL